MLRRGRMPASAYSSLGALYGSARLCRFGRGAGLSHDPRPEARTSEGVAGGSEDRPPHAGALAPVVAGYLCGQFVLERSSRPIHAAVVPKDSAFVLVRELRGRTARPPSGPAQVPGPDHDPNGLERVGYVRLV